jgi:NADPH:quinone reductase-like Zn-dependent oxidoreductase
VQALPLTATLESSAFAHARTPLLDHRPLCRTLLARRSRTVATSACRLDVERSSHEYGVSTTLAVMRTWEFNAVGLDHLAVTERSEPEPGDNDVLVRMNADSLNYRDWLIANGTYRFPVRYPLVPLSDGAGEIVAVGRSVTRWRAGDRVVTSFFSDWVGGAQTSERAATALGGAVDGVLSECVVLPAHGVARAPEHMTDVEAATLPCAALTAWHSLFEGGDPLRPGQTVLLEGTGGVSIFGLQLAKLAGARVINYVEQR